MFTCQPCCLILPLGLRGVHTARALFVVCWRTIADSTHVAVLIELVLISNGVSQRLLRCHRDTSEMQKPRSEQNFLHERACNLLQYYIRALCAGKCAVLNYDYAPIRYIIMPPPLIGGGIKRCFCLTSVCLSRTSGLTREQRGQED